MKHCLTIINTIAGSSKKITFQKVEDCLGSEFEYTHLTLPCDRLPNIEKVDAIAVCGGDGTLGAVLEKVYNLPIDVYYFPVGTLNDKAKAERYSHAKAKCPTCDTKTSGQPIIVGKCQNCQDQNIYGEQTCSNIFTYVLACGAFTPIGYTAKVELKKRFGILAYIGEVLKEYHPHRIEASIEYDGQVKQGEFALIMFLKSPRCFGFNFNKAFDPESMSGHLIAIRSPKHKGVLGYIEMFFPFFRVFFLGLKNEKDTKNILFKRIYSANITLKNVTDFCKDGDKLTLNAGLTRVSFKRSACNFFVINKF